MNKQREYWNKERVAERWLGKEREKERKWRKARVLEREREMKIWARKKVFD